ncbi:DUF3592 domain-containing protein [Piscinibacter defluvii]|uniref:DUF3592 domain-containing protein n=1 Tax=Piscinibacter defluvii TaxID=1796922 RepID=UPI000FDEA38A
MKRHTARFFATTFVAVSIALLWHLASLLHEALRSSEWPSVPGRIVSSQLGSVYCGESGGCTIPEVRYVYSVGGQSLTGNRVSFMTVATNLSFATKTVEVFPRGSKVTVYYDPKAPAHSVLQNGLDLSLPCAIISALAFLVIGILLAVQGFRTTNAA